MSIYLIVALIAYLQRLGKDGRKAFAQGEAGPTLDGSALAEGSAP